MESWSFETWTLPGMRSITLAGGLSKLEQFKEVKRAEPWGLGALAEADSIDPDRENKSMIRTLYWSSLPANTSL